MTIKNLGDLVIYLGAVAAALTAIGYLVYRWLVRPSVRWLKAELTTTREATQAVQAEMSPNSGHSLRDSVDRVETKVDQLGIRLDDHLRHHPGR